MTIGTRNRVCEAWFLREQIQQEGEHASAGLYPEHSGLPVQAPVGRVTRPISLIQAGAMNLVIVLVLLPVSERVEGRGKGGRGEGGTGEGKAGAGQAGWAMGDINRHSGLFQRVFRHFAE